MPEVTKEKKVSYAYLEPALHTWAKMEAAKRGITYSEFIEQLVRKEKTQPKSKKD